MWITPGKRSATRGGNPTHTNSVGVQLSIQLVLLNSYGVRGVVCAHPGLPFVHPGLFILHAYGVRRFSSPLKTWNFCRAPVGLSPLSIWPTKWYTDYLIGVCLLWITDHFCRLRVILFSVCLFRVRNKQSYPEHIIIPSFDLKFSRTPYFTPLRPFIVLENIGITIGSRNAPSHDENGRFDLTIQQIIKVGIHSENIWCERNGRIGVTQAKKRRGLEFKQDFFDQDHWLQGGVEAFWKCRQCNCWQRHTCKHLFHPCNRIWCCRRRVLEFDSYSCKSNP